MGIASVGLLLCGDGLRRGVDTSPTVGDGTLPVVCSTGLWAGDDPFDWLPVALISGILGSGEDEDRGGCRV